ncbi:MAG: flagellar biosynthesis protein FliQ [Bacillota bacterium]|jgi:flagellar biosynthetic protein FliQ|nr:flagellar biosynthesis protein FliQ [Bacillota bacterium]
MTPGALLGVISEAVKVILIMVAPILGFSLLVGLTVSILQATTQIQEQTLAFVPKIITVLLVLMLLGGWIIDVVVQFTLKLWGEGLVPF